jgi:hypothetical protein
MYNLINNYNYNYILFKYFYIMNFWKWSNGDKCEKSIRKQNNNIQNINNNIQNVDNNIQNVDNIYLFMNDNNNNNTNNENKQNSREELVTKMAERNFIYQRGINPFLTDNNYVNDIILHDKYLIPKNTINEDEIK